MSGRSLQEAFTRMMVAEGSSDAAAGMPRQPPPEPQSRTAKSGRPAPSPAKASAKTARAAKELGSAARLRSQAKEEPSSLEGRERRRSAAQGSVGASVSAQRRNRSVKRCDTTPVTKVEDDTTVSRLKQEVLAKDDEIVKLRLMCQEQASRLQLMESQKTSEVEALKLRMEEFEQLLKGATASIESSKVAAPAWSERLNAQSVEEPARPEAIHDTPTASESKDIQGMSTQGTEDAKAAQAPAGQAPAAEGAVPASSSSRPQVSKPRSRSTDAPEVRPLWASLNATDLRAASPRQMSKAPWGPMLSPRNSLRSAEQIRPAAKASSSLTAPLSSSRSGRASLGATGGGVTVRKVASQATIAACPVASGNRSRSPSAAKLGLVPMLGHAMSTGALSHIGGMAQAFSAPDSYRQISAQPVLMPSRTSRATLPGRPVQSWQEPSSHTTIPQSLPCRNVNGVAYVHQASQPAAVARI